MVKNPLITVYVVNHNYGCFLEEAMESVLNQSFQNFEILLIDDGSTDNSERLLKKYEIKDSVNVIRQKNKGLNITNNIALRISSGKYIMRLDADDYLEKNALSTLVGELEKNPEYALIFPDYYEVTESGKILHRVKRNNFQKEVKLLDLPAHGACTMIRRDILNQLGGYDESFNRQDGYDIWLKIIYEYKIANINKPLFYYRKHAKSLTSNEIQILGTRAKIFKKHVSNRNISDLKILTIIPIRGNSIDSRSRPLSEIKGKELAHWTIDEAIECNEISEIVVTTPDIKMINQLKLKYKDKIITIPRDQSLARINEDISLTINDVLKSFQKEHIDAVLILNIESPFRSKMYMTKAINVMQIFDVDVVIGARLDDDIFYQHDGTGLKPWKDSGNSRLERDNIYKKVGGMTLVNKKFFDENKKIIGGRVGHVVLDQKAAFDLKTDIDWKIAEIL